MRGKGMGVGVAAAAAARARARARMHSGAALSQLCAQSVQSLGQLAGLAWAW